MPSVSVIVPVCNVERYLRECLQSVFDQTLGDLEVICVNDGSTDGSPALLREIAASDARIRIIDKENAGYGAAVNDGIDASTGEYVTILDADDLLPGDACESMLAFARENGDLDFLKADAKVFTGPEGNRTYDYVPASTFSQWYEAPFASRNDPGRIRARVGAPGLYKKAFLDEYGIRLHESPGASFQDTGLWTLCTFAGRNVRYLDKCCYLIRRDNPDSSEKNPAKVYCICDEYDFIRSRIEEMDVDRDACRRACAFFRHQGYRWNLGRIADEFRLEFLDRFSNDFRNLDETGELDWSYFTEDEQLGLDLILNNPIAEYYRSYYENDRIKLLKERCEALEATVEEYRTSRSFRLGQSLSAPLRAIRGQK